MRFPLTNQVGHKLYGNDIYVAMQQITNTILMIRPVNFRMNKQTAVNNFYQKELKVLYVEL